VRRDFVAFLEAFPLSERVSMWSFGRYTLEMADERTYSFGSRDNNRTYERELLLTGRTQVVSTHGVICSCPGQPSRSVVVGACGGATGVHERSLALQGAHCFVVVGPELVCLSIPDLTVRWHRQGDPATCFGVYALSGEDAVMVHGELEISKWRTDGARLWSFSGADIFTGEFVFEGDAVVAEDFEGRRYRIDLASGAEQR
jgi:hypothetical protein